MIQTYLKMGALAVSAALSSNAQAGLIIGAPVVVPFDNASVTVKFVGFEAAYTGHLYFLGSGDGESVFSPAPNSDATGLGQFLFENQTATAGSSVALIGTFDAGEVLHFAYNVIAPAEAADLFRTTVEIDKDHFAYDAGNGSYRIEDLRPHESDFDYNDMKVDIKFVPTPGTLVLMLAASCTGFGRRRRSA